MGLAQLDHQHLLRIIELQTCIIEGRNIKAILHKYMDVFRNNTHSDIIALCLKEEEELDIRYILEEKRTFAHLIKQYFPERKKFSWSDFMEHCKGRFLTIDNYLSIDNFHQLFKGFLPKEDSLAMGKELGLKKAIVMPLYNKENNDKIGFIIFISLKDDIDFDITEVQMSTKIFQSILQPLYDREHYTLYSKCVRINDQMKLLTPQEKRIVKKVLEGYTYPEISEQLSISTNTIKTHMKNIFSKYGVNSKLELYKKFNANH